MTMLRNSLTRYTARHLRIKRLVQFIFSDPVYNNVLKNCAALLCRAPRRVNRLCSSTLSGTANMSGHGSTLCSPTEEKLLCRSPVSQRSHVGNLRQTLQGKGVIHKRVETAGVYPLVCPRGVSANPRRGARRIPALRRAQLPAESQRKTLRPSGANTLTQFAPPRSAGAKKDCRPERGEPACGSSRTPLSRCWKKAAAQTGRSAAHLVCPGTPVVSKDKKKNHSLS